MQPVENHAYLFVLKTYPTSHESRFYGAEGMLSPAHPQTYPQLLWISGKPVPG